MYELYYPTELGTLEQIMISANKQDCLDRAAADGKQSYTIEFEIDDVVIMVESC